PLARAVFPTMTEPLPTADELRERVGDDELWDALTTRPLGDLLRRSFDSDLVRGIALTDGLIGTFAASDDPSLAQNRCFLYHVIGGGTGGLGRAGGRHGRGHEGTRAGRSRRGPRSSPASRSSPSRPTATCTR
ncbi:hypothetical protein HR12_26025, partial [Microbacterium sp. SUBG005]